MRRAFLAAAAALIAAARLSAHANSVSYAEFSVDRDTVHAIVRLPLDDVDLLIRLDRDLDSEVSSAELDASKPAIDAYFAKHLRVAVNGAPAPHTLDRVALWRDLSEFQYLEGGLSFHTGKVAGRLTIRLDVLTELYPSHKTLGRISAAGREERFTFESASTYDRPIGTDRMTARGLVGGGAALLALLWLVRRRKGATAAAAILFAAVAHADVIMSAAGLNSTLKTMERLIRQMADAGAGGREEALFQLGAEADGLASIMNLEVESHGMQERELIDLALSRTKELGVTIAYNRAKKKFFYDGAAFAEYLSATPRGPHAAAAEFKLLSYQFYQSSATDIAALTAAADAKKRFLARYPRFEANVEMRLYLAVDYRDLYQRYAEAHDTANAEAYSRLARAECLRITRQNPRTEQADAARQLLRKLPR